MIHGSADGELKTAGGVVIDNQQHRQVIMLLIEDFT